MGNKILIYGAGAMGTVIGALLAKSGADVRLVTRNREHIEALKSKGAQIVYPAEGEEETVKVDACLPEELDGKYDVVFLMTKQRKNPEIALFLKDFLAEDGIVCTTQNGLPEDSLIEVLGKEKVYGGICAWGATFLSAGRVEMTSKKEAMTMSVGGVIKDAEKETEIVELLRKAGISVEGSGNLLSARWSKLAINAAFSGLSVVTGLTFGEIAKRKKTKRVALGILRECFFVAHAAGVRLAPMQGHDMEKLFGGKGFFAEKKAEFLLPIAMKKHKLLVSGMLKDLEKGRKCEIDSINGVIVRYGRQCGIETPLNEKAVEIAHGIENGLYEISPANIDFF